MPLNGLNLQVPSLLFKSVRGFNAFNFRNRFKKGFLNTGFQGHGAHAATAACSPELQSHDHIGCNFQ